jgi:hypothetical protein
MNMQELQAMYPDVPPDKLLHDMHQKFYSDVPFNDFALKMGAGPRQDPAKGGDSSVMGLVKSGASGLAKGLVAGTVGLPGDMAGMGGQMASAITGDSSMAQPGPLASHGTPYMLKEIEQMGLPLHKPANKGEKYVDESAAGAGAMIPGAWKNVLMRMGIGGIAGAAGQAGSDVMAGGNEDSPVGRILGNLLPVGVAGYFGMRKPNVVKALQKDLQDLTPEELRAASEHARKTQNTLGTDVTLPQGFMDPTALSGVSQELTRSSSGDILRRVLNRQLPIGQAKIDSMVYGASPKSIDQQTANQVLAAGDKAIERPSNIRSRTANPSYEAAGRERVVLDLAGRDKGSTHSEVQGVAEPRNGTNYNDTTTVDLSQVIQRLRERREELHLTGTPAGNAMDKYEKNIIKMAEKYPDGVPVLNLDALAKQARDAATAAENAIKNGGNSKVSSMLGHSSVSQILNEVTTAASANLKQGKDLYSRSTRAIVDPVENSVLTSMFPAETRKSGKGNWDQFRVVLDDGKYGPRDIAFAAENLRRADPQAFPAIVKQSWLQKSEAARSPVEGRAPQQGLGDFATAVAGAPGSQARQKFEETVKQLAITAGKTPEEALIAARGSADVIEALHTVSRDRGGLGQINPEEFRRAAGASAVGSGFRAANVVAPTQGIGRAIERSVQKRTYEVIANALSSPDGVETLLRIAKYHQPKEMALQFVRGLALENAQFQSNTAGQPTQ